MENRKAEMTDTEITPEMFEVVKIKFQKAKDADLISGDMTIAEYLHPYTFVEEKGKIFARSGKTDKDIYWKPDASA